MLMFRIRQLFISIFCRIHSVIVKGHTRICTSTEIYCTNRCHRIIRIACEIYRSTDRDIRSVTFSEAASDVRCSILCRTPENQIPRCADTVKIQRLIIRSVAVQIIVVPCLGVFIIFLTNLPGVRRYVIILVNLAFSHCQRNHCIIIPGIIIFRNTHQFIKIIRIYIKGYCTASYPVGTRCTPPGSHLKIKGRLHPCFLFIIFCILFCDKTCSHQQTTWACLVRFSSERILILKYNAVRGSCLPVPGCLIHKAAKLRDCIQCGTGYIHTSTAVSFGKNHIRILPLISQQAAARFSGCRCIDTLSVHRQV